MSREERVEPLVEALSRARDAAGAAGAMTTVVADLGDVDATARAAAAAGAVDLLVNGAGVGGMKGFLDVDVALFDHLVSVNCRAPLQISQIVARGMMERGTGGAVVHVSSQSSTQAIRDRCASAAPRGGRDLLSRILSAAAATARRRGVSRTRRGLARLRDHPRGRTPPRNLTGTA